jgi:hypothetical protein
MVAGDAATLEMSRKTCGRGVAFLWRPASMEVGAKAEQGANSTLASRCHDDRRR